MARLSPYAEQHKNPRGPGDARPTAVQVVRDQSLVDSPDWAGRVVLVTGCSPGGLGLETARAIHLTGADVYITCRDVAKGQQVVEEIKKDGRPGKVVVVQMDLGSLESVRAAADEFLRKSGNKLNVLLLNAGIMACPQGKTRDGFDLQLGTNYLGHFLLFNLLQDALLASATPAFNSRVVSVASSSHGAGKINFDDLHFERTEYTPFAAYDQSKLANVLFANEIDRRYGPRNLHAVSLNPGGVLTPLFKHVESGAVQQICDDPVLGGNMKSPEQGAATSVWAAVAKELEGKGGIYLDRVAEGWLTPSDRLHHEGGYAAHAFDPPTEKRLWGVSLTLTGLGE